MPNSRRSFYRLGAIGAGVGLFLATAIEACSVLVGRNLHVVIPNRVYRCAQPSSADVRELVRDHDVKTVINLRGFNTSAPWYLTESRATADLDVAQEDVTFSAGRLPDPVELKRLIEILERSTYPILLHCRRGVDRTGLTSAVVKILFDNASISQARNELSYRHGHVPWGRTSAMLRFFDIYESWLDRNHSKHSPEKFREFATGGYCPGPARGTIEKIEEPNLTIGKAGVIRLRVTNTSDEPWSLKAGTSVGIHLRYQIFNSGGVQLQEGQAGLFTATVPPGESIVLMLPINRLPGAGPYLLHADLLDGPDVGFSQLGNDLFDLEFTAK